MDNVYIAKPACWTNWPPTKRRFPRKTSSAGTGCNKGPLGNNDNGREEQAVYRGRAYSYSGYNGNKHVAGGSPGNEYLRVSGLVNRPLMMKAYGYASGTALIKYSYYEDYTSAAFGPPQPSVDWMRSINHKAHHTHAYTGVPAHTILLRRGRPMRLAVVHPAGGFASKDNSWVNCVPEHISAQQRS